MFNHLRLAALLLKNDEKEAVEYFITAVEVNDSEEIMAQVRICGCAWIFLTLTSFTPRLGYGKSFVMIYKEKQMRVMSFLCSNCGAFEA